MKYYTVKEVSKKLKVSPGHIYELVKRGDLKKAPNTGRIIRIASTQIGELKNKMDNNSFVVDDSRIEVIETSLGKIRKLKITGEYILRDIASAVGIVRTDTIKKVVNEKHISKIEQSESQKIGLRCTLHGTLTISFEGLKDYLLKTNEAPKVQMLLKELKPNLDYVQTEFKEVKNSSNLPKMFEGQQVEIIEVNGELLFELYSTGMALGYVKSDGKTTSVQGGQKLYPRKERIDKVVVNADISTCVKDGHKYLTEQLLYDFMLEAKTDKCKSFRKWVTNEVLPTIRKTGGYVDNSDKFVDNYFSNLSKDVRQAIRKELVNKNKSIRTIIEPLIDELEANQNVINLIDEIKEV